MWNWDMEPGLPRSWGWGAGGDAGQTLSSPSSAGPSPSRSRKASATAPALPVHRPLREAPATGLNWVGLGSAGSPWGSEGCHPLRRGREQRFPPPRPRALSPSPGQAGRAGGRCAPRSVLGGRCCRAGGKPRPPESRDVPPGDGARAAGASPGRGPGFPASSDYGRCSAPWSWRGE